MASKNITEEKLIDCTKYPLWNMTADFYPLSCVENLSTTERIISVESYKDDRVKI